MRPPETGASPVGPVLPVSGPVFGPVTHLFSARAFSFAISMPFPVFGAHRRPVNRLYFTGAADSPLWPEEHRRSWRQGSIGAAPAGRAGHRSLRLDAGDAHHVGDAGGFVLERFRVGGGAEPDRLDADHRERTDHI